MWQAISDVNLGHFLTYRHANGRQIVAQFYQRETADAVADALNSSDGWILYSNGVVGKSHE